MNFLRRLLWVFIVLTILACCIADSRAEENDVVLRVMSANVRYGTADDGEDRWDFRKEFLAETLRGADADLIGTQEMLPFQAEYLLHSLDGYQYVGRSRNLDDADGEQCGVFYRADRFVALEVSYFWLSETPELPGSQSWDAALPRMATRLKLYDRKANRVIVYFNTHFDHRGRQARINSGRLLRRYVERDAVDYPVIVTGDFNAGEASDPYNALLASSGDGKPSPLVDTYRHVHPDRMADEGTFNGFRGVRDGARIDWVLTTDAWQIRAAEIVRDSRDGKYPSDHFFVTATLAIPSLDR